FWGGALWRAGIGGYSVVAAALVAPGNQAASRVFLESARNASGRREPPELQSSQEDIDMPVPPQHRPLNAVHEYTITRLIVNYGHGKLSLEAFERRLDEALDAKSADALVALTND